jgi:lycopene beta-cyclase
MTRYSAFVSGAELSCDVAILGGGLSGCLIALALAQKRPMLDVRIVEASAQLGGNHIWSFFEGDIAAEHRWLVEPLICHRWAGYDVIFPKYKRTLESAYFAIESERLDAVVREKLPEDHILCGTVKATEKGLVLLEDGRKIAAGTVIDARGPGDLSTLTLGWQKFVGISLHITGGHGLSRPVVMDATVAQEDGYRFFYCLPFDAETLFIEDTYYSDTPQLDASKIREGIIAFAAAKGWKTNGGGREETGVLPVVIRGDFEAYWRSTGSSIAKAGLRAGLFHATTGYSLPSAVRLAMAYAQDPKIDVYAYATAQWRKGGFYRLLDTMLFHAAEPNLRYKIFERFYRLSPSLISRFYAGQSTLADKLRLLSGRPPVSVMRALKAVLRFRR